MYQTCPKCHYTRQALDDVSEDQCPNCGLIFSKWMKQRFQTEHGHVDELSGDSESFFQRLWDTLLHVPSKTEPVVLYGRVLIFLAFLLWGWNFILMSLPSNEVGGSFMHNINLVFHEAGHVIFRPFGQFMMVLGGSLGQLLVPVIVMIAFIWKNQDNFGASIGLWWLAQSMMDLAPYIYDARAGQLILLGGVTGQDMPGIHDWRNILGTLNLLQSDHSIARMVDTFGELLMMLSMIWGGVILFKQYRYK
jgi:hypothetical protein